MKVAIVTINGLIGTYTIEGKEVKGVQLVDVIAQMKGQSDASEMLIVINSEGGDPDLAFQIAEYLEALKKPINTLVNGQCASAATILALVGEKRMIVSGVSEFFVHNPALVNVTGDADRLQRMSEYIRESEVQLAKYYSKVTGLPIDGIYPLMKRETSLTPEEALTLGFVTEIISADQAKTLSITPLTEKVSAQPIAFYQTTNNLNSIDMSKLKKLEESVDAILVKLNLKKAAVAEKAALDWKTTDATPLEVHFETESETPEEGTVVTIDGEAAADGTYAFENGVSVTVKDGKVLTVSEASEEGDADSAAIEALKVENENLKKENKKLKDADTKREKDFTALTEKVALISRAVLVGDVKLKKQAFSGNKGEQVEAEKEDYFKKRLRENKEKKAAKA